jgi:hypothetical protein
MNIITKWTLAAVCAALLAGCGSSEDKAEELLKTMQLDSQYQMIVQASTAGYASKFSDVPRDKIKKVIEEHLPKKLIKQTFIDVYADHFDSDELQLMIDANKHPEKAMAIIMGSKDGIKLAKKSVEVQADLQKDMAEAFKERDEDIIDDLNDLQDEARG